MVVFSAVTFAVLIIALLIFQIALICGAPLGHMAWGGQNKVLPMKLRISSAASLVIYAILAVIVLSKAGILTIIPEGNFLNISTWVVAAYLTFGVLLNIVSRSKVEQAVMTPVALVLAVTAYIVAIS